MSARARAAGHRVSASEDLRRKIGLLLPGLLDVGQRFVEHSGVRDLYPEFLFTSHCIIRASVPLMETARERAVAMGDDDPVAPPLARYLELHVAEEMHHDEWMLDDLAVVGRDRSTVLVRPPAPTIAALVGAQYYWVLHYHPVALLGYIALLEGYPPSAELIDDLIARSGHSSGAFDTLRKHAELDPGHSEELDELLDSLPLTREQSAVMGLSAMYSVDMYTRAIEELLEGFSQAA